MSGGEYKKRRRAQLFHQQHGRCHWCCQPMTLPELYPPDGRLAPDICTLDHLFDRTNPCRSNVTHGIPRYVAACHSCNQDRGRFTCEIKHRPQRAA